MTTVPISPIKSKKIATFDGIEPTTGTAIFQHFNNKNMITVLFSAGRHENGNNSYCCLDLSKKIPSQLKTKCIECSGKTENGYSSVSTISKCNKHFVLFSGDSGGGENTSSILYEFVENKCGKVKLNPKPIFVENTDKGTARNGLLSFFYEDIKYPTIFLSGTYGLFIYKYYNNEYQIFRHVPLFGETSGAYVGMTLYTQNLIVLGNRSKWRYCGMTLDAPNILYNIRKDKILQKFEPVCQTVSISTINSKDIITGNGGESYITGSPNIIYNFNEKMYNFTIAPPEDQLLPDISTLCMPFKVDPFITNSPPNINETKTRIVYPFQVYKNKLDFILVVNSGQPSYIWIPNENNKGYKEAIYLDGIPNTEEVYARGGTVFIKCYYNHCESKIKYILYVVIAMFNDNNLLFEIKL
jgi:hypothetical protein